MKTPYQECCENEIPFRHSPNGIDIIEEFQDACRVYLISPAFEYPVRLYGVYEQRLIAQMITLKSVGR